MNEKIVKCCVVVTSQVFLHSMRISKANIIKTAKKKIHIFTHFHLLSFHWTASNSMESMENSLKCHLVCLSHKFFAHVKQKQFT